MADDVPLYYTNGTRKSTLCTELTEKQKQDIVFFPCIVALVALPLILLYYMIAPMYISNWFMQPRGGLEPLNVSCVVGNKMFLVAEDIPYDLGLTVRADGGVHYAEQIATTRQNAHQLIAEHSEGLADMVFDLTNGTVDLSNSKAADLPVWRYDKVVNGTSTRAICGLLPNSFAPLGNPINSRQIEACSAPGESQNLWHDTASWYPEALRYAVVQAWSYCISIFIPLFGGLLQCVWKPEDDIHASKLQLILVALLAIFNEIAFIGALICSFVYAPVPMRCCGVGARRWAVAVAASSLQLVRPISYIQAQQLCCPCGALVKFSLELMPMLQIGQKIDDHMAKTSMRCARLRGGGYAEEEYGMVHDIGEGCVRHYSSPPMLVHSDADSSAAGAMPASVTRQPTPSSRHQRGEAVAESASSASTFSGESNHGDGRGSAVGAQYRWRVVPNEALGTMLGDWARFVAGGVRGIRTLSAAAGESGSTTGERTGSARSRDTEVRADSVVHRDNDGRQKRLSDTDKLQRAFDHPGWHDVDPSSPVAQGLLPSLGHGRDLESGLALNTGERDHTNDPTDSDSAIGFGSLLSSQGSVTGPAGGGAASYAQDHHGAGTSSPAMEDSDRQPLLGAHPEDAAAAPVAEQNQVAAGATEAGAGARQGPGAGAGAARQGTGARSGRTAGAARGPGTRRYLNVLGGGGRRQQNYGSFQ